MEPILHFLHQIYLISDGRVRKVSNMRSTIKKHINIIVLNRLCMLTSSSNEDIVKCDAELRVRFCIVLNTDHVRIRLHLDEIYKVLLSQHCGRTDIRYRSYSRLL